MATALGGPARLDLAPLEPRMATTGLMQSSRPPPLPALPLSAPVSTAVTVAFVLVACCVPGGLRAGNDGIRSAASHVHGTGELAVLREGTTLTVEFATPVFNLTGFEHAPETAMQAQAWTEAVRTLQEDGERLLQPSRSARCTLVATVLENPFADAVEMAAGFDHGHAVSSARADPDPDPDPGHAASPGRADLAHGHTASPAHTDPERRDPGAPAQPESDHAHQDRHAPTPTGHERHAPHETATLAGEPPGEHAHVDLQVSYRFECRRAARLRDVGVDLFAAFPGLQRLDAIYLDSRRQTAATLTASDPLFRLE